MPRQKLLDRLRQRCEEFEQSQLLLGLDILSLAELEAFHDQLQGISAELLVAQRKTFFTDNSQKAVAPWPDPLHPSSKELGEPILAKGSIACIILAGGQGTRLGWEGPKALYPIIPEQNITLLQILLEKVQRTSANYEREFPVAIMTSPLNYSTILQHLAHHRYYGLPEQQVHLLQQSMQPFLDEEKNWFLEKPGCIAMGPDGNGGVFQLLAKSGLLETWKAAGIKYIALLPIDNPLAEPLDVQAIDALERYAADVVAKCVERAHPEEKVGVFADIGGKLSVVEYTELSKESKSALKADGTFLWPYANVNQYVYSISFFESISSQPLPLHIARKKAVAWQRGEIPVVKCETFFFDLLPHAKNPKLLLYPRSSTYAPLKNKEGEKSPETVRAHLNKFSVMMPLPKEGRS